MRWLLILLFCGCSHKYEVVEEVYPGTYHTVGIKDNEVILYKTKEKLKEGQIIKIPNKAK